jgi:hypothetical protein
MTGMRVVWERRPDGMEVRGERKKTEEGPVRRMRGRKKSERGGRGRERGGEDQPPLGRVHLLNASSKILRRESRRCKSFETERARESE